MTIPDRNYGMRGLDGELARLADATHKKPCVLFGCAASLGELIAGGALDEGPTVRTLYQAARDRGISESDIRKAIRDGLARGKANPRSGPVDLGGIDSQSEAESRLITWRDAIEETSMPATKRKILDGLWHFAWRRVRIDLDLSTRQLAEAAGVDARTVRRHMRHLPRVKVLEVGDSTGARTRFRLQIPANDKSCTTPHKKSSLTDQEKVGRHATNPRERVKKRRLPRTMGEDLKHGPADPELKDPNHNRWASCSTGYGVYVALHAEDSQTASQLARKAGCHRSTVGRHLVIFEREELAVRIDEKYWLLGDGEIEHAPIGARDFDQERRDRHERERVHHHRWIHATRRKLPWEPEPDSVDIAAAELDQVDPFDPDVAEAVAA